MRSKGKKIRVAIVHLGFFYTGGGERLVLEEAIGLKKLGYEVECFVPVVEKNSYPELQKKVKIRKLFPSLPKWFPERESVQILSACLLSPVLSLRFLKFDLILGANQPGAWFGWIVKVIWRKPYLIYLAQPTRLLHQRKVDLETGLWVSKRTYLFPFLVKFFKLILHWFDQKSILGASLAFANGHYSKSILEKVYSREFLNLPAGTKNNKLTKVNPFQGGLTIGRNLLEKPFLLITNRHFPQKKFEFALLALPAIVEKYPKVSLVITGAETNYTKILNKLVAELNLENNVVFLGTVNEKQLDLLYQNAAVYLYTAPEEDFGMGIIEAMAHKTAVVSWNTAGPKYILKDGETGFLAKPFQINDFSAKILQLLESKEVNKILGKKASEFASRNFSWQNHYLKLDEGIKLALTSKYKLIYLEELKKS